MTTVIRFENVSKRYNLGLTRTSLPTAISKWFKKPYKNFKDKYLWALNDVSFELREGDSLALIGPNGAGKSTILKLLANITMPTAGNIVINGKLSALIELGAGFHPDLTGRENIYLNGTILGLSRGDVDRRFDEIVDFAGLDRFIDTPVKRYSSGMTVRLGFAVASCIEPDILLVDEVLAVGDAAFRQKCIERIGYLIANGTSLIFVSHNLELVKSVCDSAIYIEHGIVQKFGSSSEVIETYNRIIESERALKLERAQAASQETGIDFELTKIEIIGPENSPADELLNDQPAEVQIHYVAYQRIDKIHLLVRIYRSDGISCCIMRTSLDKFPITLSPGQGVISVSIDPLQLYGGMYYAVVWVMDADDVIGITSSSSDWFRVKNKVEGLAAHDAIFEPSRRWHHEVVLPSSSDSAYRK